MLAPRPTRGAAVPRCLPRHPEQERGARGCSASRTAHRSFLREEDLLRNHEALDLTGPLINLEELRVAHELLDRVLLDVSVAAEDLNGVGRDLHRGVGREALRERGVERGLATVPLVEHPRGLPREETRGLD